jgi:dethiobiotin synthetase
MTCRTGVRRLSSTLNNSSTASAASAIRVTKIDGGRWNKFADGSRFWKPIEEDPEDMRRFQRPIFVAATRQHVGKTTTSLAIVSGLQKRFKKIGFLKPVGQQHIEIPARSYVNDDGTSNEVTVRVDKDVALVREHFQLRHLHYEDMSPVIIPAGYTKKYVDGEISFEEQIKAVTSSMERIAKSSDCVVVEGTGHCAVGSIVGLNNAKVARYVRLSAYRMTTR